MTNETAAGLDVESLWAAMRPPGFPDETFDSKNAELFRIRAWKKHFVVSVLAGLATVPEFHANGIRLDWLQRLVLSHSEGKRKPPSAELSRTLNAGLDRAKVLRLEDPNEDLFCDLAVTPRGHFRIFPGQWESAAPCTQTLLHAFEALPSDSSKSYALESVYSLLRLSDEIAERAGVDRDSPSGNNPNGFMRVPPDEALRRLARRVRFAEAELVQLGVSKAALAPFFLGPEQHRFISDRPPGETPLDFYPLLDTAIGIIVASPANISLAVRAVLVATARQGSMEEELLARMIIEQQTYSEATGLWPLPSLQLSPPNRFFSCAGGCQYEQGRFLQIIQVPATFEHFPERGFASVRELGQEANRFIADDVSRFWQMLEKEGDYRYSTTVLLMGGWGTPLSIDPPINEDKAPRGWRFTALSFSDATVLGVCENGGFRDLCRIYEQVARLENDGFSFRNLSGILNLFGFWRMTDGNLIPEHLQDVQPPCYISMPTDALLAPRVEAAKKRDLRTLPLPDGTVTMVQRVDWSDDSDLRPIYASLEHLAEKRLLGAVLTGNQVWWVDSVAGDAGAKEWLYRLWYAVLEWLDAIGGRICHRFPQAFPGGATSVLISMPGRPAFDAIGSSRLKELELAETIVDTEDGGDYQARITILPEWMKYLGSLENIAEVELIAAILSQLAVGHSATRDQLRTAVLDAIGSRDWRWLHTHEVLTPLDRLASGGLVDRFREIPMSALSLVKCGSIWGFRARAAGLEINGESDCKHFLTSYRDHILNGLISDVRSFDRERLIVAAASRYQAARLEQSQWRLTIRALRAIHGEGADASAFKQQNAINAVQRAAKSICEIAACEAPESGGTEPGLSDLEEMFAKSLLVLGNGQLFAAIRSGLIKSELRISPAGDLLSDRSISRTIMTPGAEWTNTRALNEAAAFYGRPPAPPPDGTSPQRLPWDDELRKAIEAEYGVSPEALVDLPFVLVQVAEQRGVGAFIIKSSELANLLTQIDTYASENLGALLERLTLPRRASWRDRSSGLTEADIDLGRLDRRFSLINRPMLALSSDLDPTILVAPILVSDAMMYSLSGLMDGSLNERFWNSREAVEFAGHRGNIVGEEFENSVAARLKEMGLEAWPRVALSWALNEKVDKVLGNVDVLAISPDRKRVWVIEAKNLKLCRTESEVASRLSEYRGRMVTDSKGREKPDKMLRHIKRVQYLRQRNGKLCGRLKLATPPEVKGLLIVDAPQPMNFYMLDALEDAASVFLDAVGNFAF